jgi:hypothetical protein
MGLFFRSRITKMPTGNHPLLGVEATVAIEELHCSTNPISAGVNMLQRKINARKSQSQPAQTAHAKTFCARGFQRN